MSDFFIENKGTAPCSQSPSKSQQLEAEDPVFRFRFLPESYLASVSSDWDYGLDHLLYVRSLIEEEAA
jgi:hypothetical protein